MSYNSGLFDEAVGMFTNSISREGKTKVKAAPSLSDANNCRPYHVVVKRNKKWFWKRDSKYFPSPFTLSDLLVDDGDKFEEEATKIKFAVNYQTSMKIDANGKLGLSLGKEVAGFDVNANHHVDVSVDFGKVVENALDVREVVKALQEKKLNMKNHFITETLDNTRQVLCLVVASFNNEKDAKITTNIKGGGSASAKLEAGPEVPVKVEGEAGGSREKNRCIMIPANTPLAYRLDEMLVREDGSIQLLQVPGSKGGFKLRYANLHDLMPDAIIKEIRYTVERLVAVDFDRLLERGQRYSDIIIPKGVLEEIRRVLNPIINLKAAEGKDDREYLDRFFSGVHPYEIKEQLEPILKLYSEPLRDLPDYLTHLIKTHSELMPTWRESANCDVIEVGEALSIAGVQGGSILNEMEDISSLHDGGLRDVRKGLIELLNHPLLLEGLGLLVEEASNALLVGEGGKMRPKESLQEQLGCKEIDDTIISLLQLAGFTFQDNDVKYPCPEDYKALNFLDDILELLTPLNEDQRRILCELSDEERETIVKVVSGALSPSGFQFRSDIRTVDLFQGSTRAESLVHDLGFKRVTFGGQDSDVLVYRGVVNDDGLNPFGLLAIMSTLWGYE